ncbi:ribosomal-protein-alanine acetyltransferase [Pseudohongiella acticola]|uniref:Ribosomal-protein-alanine acetyltransferase n=1 Tax=Pseudohongiella acticola TaxID=1524254 RepID=A0A1E8CK50_9GAMM|nr:GNAT family N-acetyltransferase/peptidase C39 family protein [Pseudohongiella acticola]OFE12799.1 ribosomal-protein-alanine acetyltransferase [Pseudohongiella acticola]
MPQAKIRSSVKIRPAVLEDLDALYELEKVSFDSDRLSRRRLRHWIQASNRELMVAVEREQLLGYGLVLFHGATHLARLYSIAIAKQARGKGIGAKLLQALESASVNRQRFFMRLEVAKDNTAAIRLYESAGYVAFGTYEDYYEDHRDALRMQKIIRDAPKRKRGHTVPWYQQTTGFTCGPASLMMAMATLDSRHKPDQATEFDIWREATTIFMTSGHGGCHPFGLALAAHKRGFNARIYVNQSGPLFLEGVRAPDKKVIMSLVHDQFLERVQACKIPIAYQDITQQDLEQAIKDGAIVLALVSSYRLDRKKAPHWVTITAYDDACFFVHDPDPSLEEQTGLDCEDLPIARNDFARMSQFGKDKLRTAVVISAPGSRAGARTRS